MSEQEQRTSGPDVLVAFVYGHDVPALKTAALDKARDLYGPDARLVIEHVSSVHSSSSSGGAFCAHVHVRCLNFPEEER